MDEGWCLCRLPIVGLGMGGGCGDSVVIGFVVVCCAERGFESGSGEYEPVRGERSCEQPSLPGAGGRD